MVVVIAGSRVYLGAHWASDVVGTLSLAVFFVAGSELLIEWLHRHHAPAFLQCGVDLHVTSEDQSGAT
jgi:membrane-associated phospholipid phosphatase